MLKSLLDQWMWLIPILPWLGSAWIAIGFLAGFNRGEKSERQTSRIMLLTSFLSFVLIFLVAAVSIIESKTPGLVTYGLWLKTGEYTINLSLIFDWLSIGIALVVALVSILSLRFSINYMHREVGFQRFFMILGLFNGAMLLIILAGNSVLTFFGWEIAGVSSYLLIAYSWDKPNATRNANLAFITNRIGDVGFIIALTFSFLWLGNVEFSTLNNLDKTTDLALIFIIVGFLLAAMAKSALFPFSAWISRALEGPTPSSAIFYGSLMVHAGVYLMLRIQPLLEHSPLMMMLILIIGVLTALYGFLSGLVQSDIKSSLMFSTTGQIGLMFIAIGLGWFEFAAWYLALHAIWRAYHFLNAPMMMHLMNRRMRPAPKWLQNRGRLYTACIQRFWLDSMTDSMLVRPTQRMAKDIENFDEHVINRMVGLPASVGAISTLAQWESNKGKPANRLDGDTGDIGRGSGAMGMSMQWLASIFHWFESRLVLKGGDTGVLNIIQHIGKYLTVLEDLLSQPRYLILMIAITFVVIL